MRIEDYLVISPHLKNAKAVVTLECTVISHGLPYPANLQTAQALEKTVSEYGAIPATIALLNGKIKIGLEAADLEELATSKSVAKVSRRDLPVILANKSAGATTVAATMIAAHLAGIQVFGTGGLGGVHRGASTTLIYRLI